MHGASARTVRAGFLIVAASLLGARDAKAACSPAALVTGPPEIRDRIVAILRADKVSSEPPTCQMGRVVHATLTRVPRATDYLVRIRDGSGHTIERRVSNPTTAATLIEMWVTREDADLLAPPPIEDREVPAGLATTATSTAEGSTWRVQAAAELAVGVDGSLWRGANITACRSLGPTCLGGRVRFAWDDGAGGPSEDFGQVQRSGELLVVAARPYNSGRVSIIPLLGLGGSWTVISPQAGTETDPVSRYALRLEAALTAGVAFVGSWSVTGEVGVTLAGPSSSGTFAPGASIPEPTAVLHAGVGLGYAP